MGDRRDDRSHDNAPARLDAVNPAINAIVDHRPEDVLAQAAGIDAAIARGDTPGPLAGVPVTVKVNIDQEGFATTNGLKLQREVIARSNSPVTAGWRRTNRRQRISSAPTIITTSFPANLRATSRAPATGHTT